MKQNKETKEILKLNRRYLVDRLQISEARYLYGLMCIKCIESTEKAYKIRHENGNTQWILKGLGIDIVEELDKEIPSPKMTKR